LNDADALEPPESSRSPVVGAIRLLVLGVVFVGLPMLLLAAMIPPQGCGGG
jgi:hypothetical protein